MKMAYLSEDQLRSFLMSVSNENHYLMFLTAYWHACRVSEILSLTPESVKDGYLNLNRLKGSNATVQPLVYHPDSLLDEKTRMMTYAQTVKPGQKLFPLTRFKVDKLMKRYGAKAGIPRPLCHAHVLKHSLAKHMLKRGADLPTIQQYLGHKSLSSTGEYLKSNDIEASANLSRIMGLT